MNLPGPECAPQRGNPMAACHARHARRAPRAAAVVDMRRWCSTPHFPSTDSPAGHESMRTSDNAQRRQVELFVVGRTSAACSSIRRTSFLAHATPFFSFVKTFAQSITLHGPPTWPALCAEGLLATRHARVAASWDGEFPAGSSAAVESREWLLVFIAAFEGGPAGGLDSRVSHHLLPAVDTLATRGLALR